MANGETVIVETARGRLRGAWEDGAASFRAIPYAAPPIGSRRFRPPAPAAAWAGVREAIEPAAIPPQTPSRLSRVLGDYDLRQDEDCLTLDVLTPATDEGRRPVMVWLYGGAFVTGGTAIPWYDGAAFARNHGIVFVAVNYRLGALGYLTLGDVSPGNLGLMDQIAALGWVQENIARFGGDPGQVTVAGQSAGAISVLALLAARGTAGLFQRAILQSGRFNAIAEREESRASGRSMLALAGISGEALRELPLERLLALQVGHIRANAAFGLTTTPFRPHADGDLVPAETLDAAARGARGKAVLLGWTRDEMAAFFAGNPDILAGSAAEVEAVFRSQWGGSWRAGMAYTRARRPGASPDRFLDLGLNECMFAGSTIAFAERLARVEPAWLYRFDWAAPGNPFGACHCIELPFVFDNAERWPAPMLAGAAAHDLAALGRTVQSTWAQFVRVGDPDNQAIPPWPRYALDRRWTLRFDQVVETVGDLAGVTLPGRPWPSSLPLPEGVVRGEP